MSEVLRAPRHEDAAAVAELMSRDTPEPVDAQRVLGEWTFPGVQLDKDARRGRESYAFVDGFGDERVWIDVAGRPAPELLDWAENRARELGSRLLSGGWMTQEALLAELERRGFRLIRTSFRMAIDLAGPMPDAVWPADVQPRAFRPGDERVFYELHQETFADSWEPIEETYEQWAHQFLAAEALAPELWTLAVADGDPAGIAICHPHAVESDLGWVRILGIRRPYRGRGLGRALLLRAFAQFRRQGMKRVGLGVESESPTAANALYKSVGMHVVARFAIHEKSGR
ncbi:MAG: GNAT family N-acetyltransferase [Gaiellaceae bacterium]